MTVQTQPTKISTWQIDPAHTTVEFAIKHLMVTTVKGYFGDVRGTIVIDEADPARSLVDATIGAASIDTRNAQRDAHLRAPDFLDVERYPTITFRSRRVEPRGTNAARIIGDLTIRDVTREVVLDATLEGRGRDPWGNERIGFSARTTIDRRDFGLTWNEPLETGGFLLGDQVEISLDVEAIRQS
jgi:polyisoprenoid-binding protein YceI